MNSKNSIIKQYTSVEDYIEKNFNTFKFNNPERTKRQIHLLLQEEWNKKKKQELSKKIKIEKPSINQKGDSEEIYITIESINNETQIKNKKKNKNRNRNRNRNRSRKSTKQNKEKKVLIKNVSDPSLSSLDIHSLEERVSNIQIDVLNNQSKTKPSKNICNQPINIKNEQNTKNGNIVKNNKQNKVAFKQLDKITQNIDCQNAFQEKPIPIQDFINSANFINHISILRIQKDKTNQGQIEIDKIKSIVSHTYGIVNHYKDTSNLNLQLFLQVEFHPRLDGTIPDDTYCTAKQAALYNRALVLEYLSKNNNIFTQDCDYYIN